MRIRFLYALTWLIISILSAGCNGHEIEQNQVYYVSWNEGSGKNRRLIEGADAATFKELDHPRYGIDKNSVYYETRKLADADPDSFVALLDYYGKDKHYAYKGASKIKGASGPTFEVLDGGPYSRDSRDYFFDTTALQVTDLKSFRMLSEVDQYGYWAKDKTHYYLLARKYPLADYASFTVLGEGYAKDKRKVYFRDRVVEGADPETFRVIEYAYGQDKYARYEGDKKLRIKDPDTFEVLQNGYTKDKFFVYSNDSIITGADPATFTIVTPKWARDKTTYYYQGKPMPIVDHKTFVTLQDDYAKDKNRVYYASYVVEGADPATFEVNEFTYAGKDKFGCYRNGERVDCNQADAE
jgi:hypothetical protein